MQVIFAGAATLATLTLLSAVQPGDAENGVASGSVRMQGQIIDLPAPAAAPVGPQIAPSGSGSAGVIAVDDDDSGGGVNDNGQSSGDIFTQNAQDQSTA